MKRIGFILLLFTSSVGFAQKYAVKTNLAYWATTTLNIGGEIALAPRMTLDMTANYNPFHFRGNKKIMHWAVQPEWRYWTCRRFMGHFIGVHAHGGKYNGGLRVAAEAAVGVGIGEVEFVEFAVAVRLADFA